jgi:hypothetical protein
MLVLNGDHHVSNERGGALGESGDVRAECEVDGHDNSYGSANNH